jgi:hypothetical protein
MPRPDLGTTVRTLLLNGFHLDMARRAPGHDVLNVHRYDRFGVMIPYAMAFFDDEATQTASDAFLRAARYEARSPLLVAPGAPAGTTFLSSESFFTILGGTVDDALIRHTDLSGRLDLLGRHALPPGEPGDPEDLLEKTVAACLQFLTGQRAHRWGADRRFEALPDGVLPGSEALVLLFDAKSYTAPYEVTADDIRRFADYVDNFNRKYAAFLGPVYAFLVVAGAFAQNETQRAGRAEEL